MRFVNLSTQISEVPEFAFFSTISNQFYTFNKQCRWSNASDFANDYKKSAFKNPKWRESFPLKAFLEKITDLAFFSSAGESYRDLMPELKEFISRPQQERLPYSEAPARQRFIYGLSSEPIGTVIDVSAGIFKEDYNQ